MLSRTVLFFLVFAAFFQASGQKIEIVVSGWATTSEEHDELAGKIRSFNLSQKKIEVIYDPITMTDYYHQNLLGRMKSGTPPDVFYVRDADLSDYLRINALKPLQSLLGKAGLKTQSLYKPATDAFRRDKDIYAIPKDFNIIGINVNEKYRKLAGLSASGPKTFDELSDWFKKLNSTVGSLKKDARAMVISGHDFEILPFIAQASVPGWESSPLSKDFLFPAYNFYSVQNRNQVILLDFNVLSSNLVFTDQKVASVIQGIWFFPYYDKNFPELDYRVYPLPAIDKKTKPRTVMTTVGWGISSTCKDTKSAMVVLAYLVNTFNYEEWLVKGVAFPSTTKALSQILQGKNSRHGAKELLKAAGNETGLNRWRKEDIDLISHEFKSMMVSLKNPDEIVNTILIQSNQLRKENLK
ncbi:MAG: extracellular solute-binding protein [Bacteroidetes bacterium]|nr:extracellular solute-binding protein [Bacteroidota bacterium]